MSTITRSSIVTALKAAGMPYTDSTDETLQQYAERILSDCSFENFESLKSTNKITRDTAYDKWVVDRALDMKNFTPFLAQKKPLPVGGGGTSGQSVATGRGNEGEGINSDALEFIRALGAHVAPATKSNYNSVPVPVVAFTRNEKNTVIPNGNDAMRRIIASMAKDMELKIDLNDETSVAAVDAIANSSVERNDVMPKAEAEEYFNGYCADEGITGYDKIDFKIKLLKYLIVNGSSVRAPDRTVILIKNRSFKINDFLKTVLNVNQRRWARAYADTMFMMVKNDVELQKVLASRNGCRMQDVHLSFDVADKVTIITDEERSTAARLKRSTLASTRGLDIRSVNEQSLEMSKAYGLDAHDIGNNVY